MAVKLLVDRKREVFAALVAVQDSGLDVAASRKLVAARYGLTLRTLEKIEKEEIEAQWPPLDA